MRSMIRPGGFRVLLPLLVLLLAASSCSKKPKPAVTPPPEPPKTEQPQQPAPVTQPEKPPEAPLEMTDIFFDFDKSAIRGDQRAAMEADAKALADHPDATVLLEGHCDERGTVEYNLALGQRRADSVKNYLVQYGIAPSRISTISYGEERPFAQGHDEAAWALNRRVHFVLK